VKFDRRITIHEQYLFERFRVKDILNGPDRVPGVHYQQMLSGKIRRRQRTVPAPVGDLGAICLAQDVAVMERLADGIFLQWHGCFPRFMIHVAQRHRRFRQGSLPRQPEGLAGLRMETEPKRQDHASMYISPGGTCKAAQKCGRCGVQNDNNVICPFAPVPVAGIKQTGSRERGGNGKP